MFKRGLRVDLRQGDLRHHRVFGEGGSAHEVANLLAVAGKAGAAIGEMTEVLLRPDRHTEVGAGVKTMLAFTALG